MRTQPIIVGTAGHIDHGKTSLVLALTGIDTDRLKEEKRRGITIELGFAHLDLGQDPHKIRLGLVDVPGHERFLRAMVAGAGGVDLVILVIAADEGVMPQTREHLAICELLGARRGVIALTKADRVEREWLDLVAADVSQTVAGTFLSDAKLIPCSALTGAGLDDLRAELARLAGELPPRSAEGPFRLPLDRVFTMKGFGTVASGTVWGGRVRVGDDVEILPGGRVAKVRGLQSHGVAVDEARAGMRCAVNLAGVERAELERGDLLAHPGTLVAGHLVDARLRHLPTSKSPLGHRARILVHHGTAQVMAQVILVDRVAVQPGEEALVQLHLDEPIAAIPGDRFIARGFQLQAHHGTTLGGGEVIRVQPPKLRKASAQAAETLRHLAGARPAERVALEIAGAGPAGLSRAAIEARLGLAAAAIDGALTAGVAARELLADGDHYLHAGSVARVEALALAAIDAFIAAAPHKDGMPREELRSRLPRSLPPRLFDKILEGLVARQTLVGVDDWVGRRKLGPKPTNTAIDRLVARVVEHLQQAGLETPRPEDLPATLALSAVEARTAIEAAQKSGRLVRIKPDYFVEAGVLATLRDRLRAHLAAHGQITPQEWKAMTGTTRKYAIPLAEHFDAEKVTLRVGEIRKKRG